jgi:outer membrane lipoprotein-sorting protein
MKRIALFLFVLLGAALLSSSGYGAGPEDGQNGSSITGLLERLGKKAAQFSTLKTDLVQVKNLSIFKNSVTLRGRIYLQKPGKIAWHVDAPVRYSVYMDSTVVRQWDEDTDKVQEISLSGNPVFRNVLNQLTVWFSGDYRSLVEGNTIRIVRSAPLTLEFAPKQTNIAHKVIKSITITYRDDETYLHQIAIREVNGDSTTITFTNTVVDTPLTPRDFEVKPRV